MSFTPELSAAPVPEGALLFNRYRYLREIGRGGMGRVILAHDEVLAIDVALKLVPEEVVRDAGGLRDLKREVLRGMALSHSNIVRVHSFEQDAERGAIVMEYVDGENLADAKERQPQGCYDHETLRPWLEQLCSVLDHAHREVKIAHRDLKPRNLLLTRDRKIKVADFGISCSLADTVNRLTSHSGVSGTPPYMSPQQAMGEAPSHLDDIYSLGATMYDLLTGKPPFYRGNVVMQAMQQRAPSIAARREELGKKMPPVPEAWEELVALCLAKNPDQRPGTGQEILAILHGGAAALRPTPRSPLEHAAPSPHTGGPATQERFAAEAPPIIRVPPRDGEKRLRLRPRIFAGLLQLIITSVSAGALFAGLIHLPWKRVGPPPDARKAATPARSARQAVADVPAPPPRTAVVRDSETLPPPAFAATPAPGSRLPMESRSSLQSASGLDRPPPEQRPPPPRKAVR